MADPKTPTEWMVRATEARRLAEKMRDGDARSTMRAIAVGYEKLARRAEVAETEVYATSTYRHGRGICPLATMQVDAQHRWAAAYCTW